MFTFLNSFFASPVFEDEEKSRIAALLHIILLSIMVAGIVYAVVWLIIAPNQIERLGMIAIAYPIALISLFLMRRGQVKWASIVLSSAMWLLMTFGAATSGGVQSPSFNSYIVTILGAGLLLGWHVGLVFAILSMLSGLLMLYAESYQLLPPLAVSHTSSSTWASEVVFFLMTVVLLHLATRSINDALQRTRQKERVLAQRNQELEQSRDLLAKEVAERKQVQEYLKQQSRLIGEILREMPVIVFQVDKAGVFQQLVGAGLARVGLKEHDVIGSSAFDGNVQVRVWIENALPGESVHYESHGQTNGQDWWYDTFLTSKSPRGEGAIGFAIDITERKQAEQELARNHEQLEELVRERTAQLTQVNQQLQHEIKRHQQTEIALRQSEAELKRYTNELKIANGELSQYAYVVSHDLRAPLRAIHNYADFLLEDLIESLEEEQELYLMGLRRAVQEAEQLVEALLLLSRIGRQAVQVEAVNLTNLLKQLLTSLDLSTEIALIMPKEWPTIQSEPTLLRQIMQNLILNGIKFNHASPKRIELGWQSSADAIELFVRDNGIGIEPRYQAQIFQMFQRLHTSTEYKGTGIGLAIVQKAVNKLGGTVRLDSALGQGSTFFIRLPTLSES